MADPISASALVAALKKEGVKVVEVDGWRTRNRNTKGPWGPVHGVMIHHTVTSGAAKTVAICRDGYATLPGPLCHGVITKDGRVHLVGHGRANHAGLGDDDVLKAVVNETAVPADDEANTDGNRHFYGFECENLGDGKDPWPAVQLEAIERAAAALCRHHGWDAASVIGHLEWQPGKVDPRGFTMDGMRERVQARLDSQPDGTPDPAKPAPSKPAATTGTYTVRDGDTLWSIAEEHDTTLAKLVTLNRLEDPDRIAPGQKLKVPAATATKPAPTPAAPRYEPFPGREFFHGGRHSPIITAMGRRLVAEGCGRYSQGPGPDWTNADRASYAAWQRKLGFTGDDADGIPGEESWTKLRVPKVS